MKIFLSFSNRASRLIEIELAVEIKPNQTVQKFELPLWRPGRYEAQNYSKNILYFSSVNEKGESLTHTKKDRNTWLVNCEGSRSIIVKYNYYAFQQDAGGSYIDDDLVYLNPVNFCMCADDANGVDLYINVPDSYKLSSGLSFTYQNSSYYTQCSSWYELYDSPILASQKLANYQYTVEGTVFHLWLYGTEALNNSTQVLSDFKKFTEYQFKIFGSFPFAEYHFQFFILPYKYYHGVEHRNSTVIVLGSDKDFESGVLYPDFLGISSHELFHAWNICKIRPKELFPYNYNKECYFDTGFVAEGFTTYFGDYVLYKSGAISKKEYENELEAVLKRHFSNMGNLQYSLAESSFDLWVDGYQPSHAERKVSIYDKGALVALVLDAYMERITGFKHSLADVLRDLWNDFALKNKPYQESDIYAILEKYVGQNLKYIYEECIFGKTFLEQYLFNALEIKELSIDLNAIVHNDLFIKGFVTMQKGEKLYVDKLNPAHPMYKKLSVQDEILEEQDFYLKILRNGRELLVEK